MLDVTGKKLIKLLHANHPLETRCAAAHVLGELGVRDAEAAELLCAAVDDPESAIRQQAMLAVGKLHIERALPRLLPRVSAGGLESEVAAQAAARLGAKGMKAVKELMAQAAPGLRRRIAAALAASGTTTAETAALDALLDKDPGVVDAAARSLLAELPSLSESHRRAITEHLLELLTPKKGEQLSPASETALVRVLSALGDPRGEDAFWLRIEAPNPIELRAAALVALGNRTPPENKDKVKRLLACATDTDFRIVAPALMMLNSVPISDRAVKEWLPLFNAPDVAVRRFAIDKLGERDTPEIAAALLRQLRHRDGPLRAAALVALTRRKHGREALVNALLEAETPDEAWGLARAQAAHVAELAEVMRGELFAPACSWLEAGDRRADALFFLLREADAPGVRDQLEQRALALRKKKNYAGAMAYLRYLGRDPACAEGLRFEAAACGLRLSERDLTAEARAADPTLQQFARLIHNHETDPCDRLRQAKWLDPEDLFYLGFHFAEANDHRERDFGGQVLKLLSQRSPRSKLAKDAKSKLRSLGLD